MHCDLNAQTNKSLVTTKSVHSVVSLL